jgi:hypothetical protein
MAPKTEAEAREIARRLLEEAELRRKEAEARGERFESLDEETLVKKIMGLTANSPFFVSHSTDNGPPGGTAMHNVSIVNPDTVDYSSFFLLAYLFFGPSNLIQDNDTAVTMVDTRFPRYFKGIDVAAGGNTLAHFTVNIPTGITPGIYMLNCFLVHHKPFAVGTYFDRAASTLEVT